MRGVAQTMVLEASTLFDDDNGTSLTTLDALSHMQQVQSAYVSSPHTCQHMSAVSICQQPAYVRGKTHTCSRCGFRGVLLCSWCGFRL